MENQNFECRSVRQKQICVEERKKNVSALSRRSQMNALDEENMVAHLLTWILADSPSMSI